MNPLWVPPVRPGVPDKGPGGNFRAYRLECGELSPGPYHHQKSLCWSRGVALMLRGVMIAFGLRGHGQGMETLINGSRVLVVTHIWKSVLFSFSCLNKTVGAPLSATSHPDIQGWYSVASRTHLPFRKPHPVFHTLIHYWSHGWYFGHFLLWILWVWSTMGQCSLNTLFHDFFFFFFYELL